MTLLSSGAGLDLQRCFPVPPFCDLCVIKEERNKNVKRRGWDPGSPHTGFYSAASAFPPSSFHTSILSFEFGLAYFCILHLPGNKLSLSQPGSHSWHTIAPDLCIVSWAPDLKASNVSFLMNANDIQLHFSFQTFYPSGTFCTQTIFQISITGWIANNL